MGDRVLVYFGYPQAHEDDAERAVRAGLAVVPPLKIENGRVCGSGIPLIHSLSLFSDCSHLPESAGSAVPSRVVGSGRTRTAADGLGLQTDENDLTRG